MNISLVLIVACLGAISAQYCNDIYPSSTCRYMIEVQRRSCQGTFMKFNCKRTCGLCGTPTRPPPPPTGCRDENFLCSRWDCNSARKYKCKKTCGLCGGPNTQRPTQGPPTQRPPPPKAGCGKSFYQNGRVIAGTTAAEGAWPWQVLVKSGGRAGCGGTLISEKWVVTAAHCIRGSHSVVLGEHDRNRRTGHEEEIRASRAFAHPSYNRRTFENDIALIELSKPAKVGTRYVNHACLPDRDPPVGSNCYITGWGKTSSHGQMTHILQQAPMQVIDQDVCHRKNYAAIRIPIKPSMICGGGAGRISGCQGDSGGPFVCNLGGRWELHGAVSHGSKYCQSSETYTVFARVAKFRSWIRQYAGV